MSKPDLMIIAHSFDKINNIKLNDESRQMLRDIIKDAKKLGVLKVNVKNMIYIKDPQKSKPLIFIYIENDYIKVDSRHIWNIICNL